MPLLRTGDYEIPSDWISVFKAIRNSKAVMVLGGSDTGKTTLIKYLINEFLKIDKRVAFVDSDVGQSTIGVPATICSLLISSFEDLKMPKVDSMYFVGSNSPHGNLMQMVAGVKRTVENAFVSRADLVIMDTTGFIDGAAAYELKYQKISLTQPTSIVAIQKEKELEFLLRLVSNAFPSTKILRLDPASGARVKSPSERQANREKLFSEYFSNAKVLEINLDAVSLRRGPFGRGNPLSQLKLYELSKLFGFEVLYGEEGIDDALFIARSSVHMGSTSLSMAQNYLKKGFIKVLDQNELKGVMIGLGGRNSRDFILGLGIIEKVEEGKVCLVTPVKDLNQIGVITFGSLRLSPEGKELGKMKFN
ncbi:MAG: Clp1/GlmU family protein [Thermodesulfobacteriota bacterium]